MKKLSVIVLVGLSVAFAGYAEAAKGKKRSRSANRIGAYGGAHIGFTTYSADGALDAEETLENTLINTNADIENLTSGTEDNDVGYQATFGYRFHRYFAAELGLAQFGSMVSHAKADMDFGDGAGVVPVTVKLSYSAAGPIISAIGILPINDRFEMYGRLGFLFTSTELEFSAAIDGDSAGSASAKSDSQDPVYGLGFSWHINQVYSIRGEYQTVTVGKESENGEEDLKVFGLGVVIRF